MEPLSQAHNEGGLKSSVYSSVFDYSYDSLYEYHEKTVLSLCVSDCVFPCV